MHSSGRSVRLSSAVLCVPAMITVVAGCYSGPEFIWRPVGAPVRRTREKAKKTVVSAPVYTLRTERTRISGMTVSVPCEKAVMQHEETTLQDYQTTKMEEISRRKLNWAGKNARGIALTSGLVLVGLGIKNMMQYDYETDYTPGNEDTEVGQGIEGLLPMTLGMIPLGLSQSKALKLRSMRESATGKTREDKREFAEYLKKSTPVRRASSAAGERFRLLAGAPLSFGGDGARVRQKEAEVDSSGNLAAELALPAHTYLDVASARQGFARLPEAAQTTASFMSSAPLKQLLAKEGVSRSVASIRATPLGPTDSAKQKGLSIAIPLYSPARSVFYRTAGALCDLVVTAKVRRMAVSVRDTVTLKPVAAEAEFEIKAPEPDKLLSSYMSGKLLQDAVARAPKYARGKVVLKLSEKITFLTLYAPSAITSYKITAPGYETKTGKMDRVESGPLIFLLEKER